ncbi:MAG: polysaccharide deacetylase family protein [Thomasclavelia sp.]|nr:polysaccharide deacetylase family protein [Thomasclavelia sp.]
MARHKKKRQLNINKLLILIFAVALVVGGGYFITHMGKDDPYSTYNTYNKDNKKYGSVEHYKKENKNFYTSIFYPTFSIDPLNKIVKEKYKAYLTKEEENKEVREDVLYMDYSCSRVYGQFVNVTFNFKRLNMADKKNPKTITNKKDAFVYDIKQKKVLSLSDCFRTAYVGVLTSKNFTNTSGKNTLLQISTKGVTIYKDNNLKEKTTINFNSNKSLNMLANKNIPSDRPTGITIPKTHKVDTSKKLIAITLDDGPGIYTDRAMNAFESVDGRATFFELGESMKKYPDTVLDVYERGFEIGSHTYDHAQLTKLDAASLSSQIDNTQDECFKITGYEPTLVRPPYGAINDNVRAAFANRNLKYVLWDVDTLDWKHRDANYVCDQIVSKAQDGKVILIHDIHETSVAGLELALPKLQAAGYQCVTVSELLQYKTVDCVH